MFQNMQILFVNENIRKIFWTYVLARKKASYIADVEVENVLVVHGKAGYEDEEAPHGTEMSDAQRPDVN